jgi:hypothetical protein
MHGDREWGGMISRGALQGVGTSKRNGRTVNHSPTTVGSINI